MSILANRFLIVNPFLPFGFPPSMSSEDPNQPVTLDFAFSKQIAERRTVGGWTFTHWGEMPVTITGNGGVFLDPRAPAVGLVTLAILKQLYRLDKTRFEAIKSLLAKTLGAATLAAGAAAAFGRLEQHGLDVQALVAAGLVFDAKRDLLETLSYSYIFFDYLIYGGHFRSFSYKRDANHPYRADYNFVFVVTWSSENWLVDKGLEWAKLRGKAVQGLAVR